MYQVLTFLQRITTVAKYVALQKNRGKENIQKPFLGIFHFVRAIEKSQNLKVLGPHI